MQAVCWKQNVCFQKQVNTHIFASVHVALLLSIPGLLLLISLAYSTAEIISDQKPNQWRLYSLPTSHTSYISERRSRSSTPVEPISLSKEEPVCQALFSFNS